MDANRRSAGRQPNHVVVISHPRSGTHLTIDALLNNFSFSGTHVDLDELVRRVQPLAIDDLRARLDAGPCVVKTHAHADLNAWFEHRIDMIDCVRDLFRHARLIYVFRDGRDVMVSSYYYLRHIHGSLPSYKDLEFGQFLRMSNDLNTDRAHRRLTRVDYWRDHVEGWTNRGDALTLSYESLLNEFDTSLHRIGQFIGQRQKPTLTSVVRTTNRRDAAVSWWRRGSEKIYKLYMRHWRGVAVSSVFFRAGGSGGWRAHFKPEDAQYFLAKAGALMSRLGYVSADRDTG